MNTRSFLSGFTLFAILFGRPLFAGDEQIVRPNLDKFGAIPILNNGRIMPMDSFARNTLTMFSGKKKIDDLEALEWMADLLFAPERVANQPTFMINNPDVLQGMGVETTQTFPGKRKPSTRRFSFAHLNAAYDKLGELAQSANSKPKEEQDEVDREYIGTFGNLYTFRVLASSVDYVRPQSHYTIKAEETKKALGLPLDRERFSYLELLNRVDKLSALLAPLSRDPGREMTEAQKEAMRISSVMSWNRDQLRDLPLQVLPSDPHVEDKWLSPWEGLHTDNFPGMPPDIAMMAASRAWGRMSEAYRNGDQYAFDAAAVEAAAFAHGRRPREPAMKKLEQELTLNRRAPFSTSMAMYVVAMLVGFFATITGSQLARRIAWVPMVIGLGFHVWGIVLRMILTERPPVTNLYGTFIFVGFICIVLSLVTDYFQKDGLSVFLGAFIAWIFFMMANRFSLDGQDTLGQVVAVLDSNFWLSTHVLTIVVGYAFCWFAGVVGHVYLVLRIMRNRVDLQGSSYRMMNNLLGFGLAFAFLGTFLGGVWADQSWGRFWGWDPKENGALLIVLWTAVIYHARVGGLIQKTGAAIGAAIGCQMVMFAWVGVNLLEIGLHSYGFNSAQAFGYFTYVVLQSVAIIVLGLLAVNAKPNKPAV